MGLNHILKKPRGIRSIGHFGRFLAAAREISCFVNIQNVPLSSAYYILRLWQMWYTLNGMEEDNSLALRHLIV